MCHAPNKVLLMEKASRQHSLLVVDDEKEMCDLMVDVLRRGGYEVDACQDGVEALEAFRRGHYDVVISDLRMRVMDGMELLKAIHVERPEVPVIIVTAFGSIDRAIEAMKSGAFYFVTKPFKMREMEALVAKAVEQGHLYEENRRLKKEVAGKYDFKQMIGRSKVMQKVFHLVEQVADSNSNVLILGDSGTGKELIARSVHFSGKRANGPFVPVNCSAIPEGLLESELFGHTRGAFTGAYTSRRGLFLSASGGSLFLDEIGDMGLALQAKLLRVLQDREIRPVGSSRTWSVDTRIIAATHKDLITEVRAGRFREDLYYRMSVIPIQVPALSERLEDIPLLVDHFLKRFSAENRKTEKKMTIKAMDALQQRSWEGNVRELENIIERLVVLTPGSVIDVDDLPASPRPADCDCWFGTGEMLPLREVERKYVERILQETNGNKDKAAKILGINRRTLYRMKERLDQF